MGGRRFSWRVKDGDGKVSWKPRLQGFWLIYINLKGKFQLVGLFLVFQPMFSQLCSALSTTCIVISQSSVWEKTDLWIAAIFHKTLPKIVLWLVIIAQAKSTLGIIRNALNIKVWIEKVMSSENKFCFGAKESVSLSRINKRMVRLWHLMKKNFHNWSISPLVQLALK